MVTVILMRPLHMIVREAIVLFSCTYLSLAYAIFYLFFEAYPIIFQGVYKFNAGVTGLAFLPMLVGAVATTVIFYFWDGYLHKSKKQKKAWADVEEYRRLPLACFGGPLYVISLLWLGWTSKASIHWIVPMLAGIPSGLGFMLIFMVYEFFTALNLILPLLLLSLTSISEIISSPLNTFSNDVRLC